MLQKKVFHINLGLVQILRKDNYILIVLTFIVSICSTKFFVCIMCLKAKGRLISLALKNKFELKKIANNRYVLFLRILNINFIRFRFKVIFDILYMFFKMYF